VLRVLANALTNELCLSYQLSYLPGRAPALRSSNRLRGVPNLQVADEVFL